MQRHDSKPENQNLAVTAGRLIVGALITTILFNAYIAYTIGRSEPIYLIAFWTLILLPLEISGLILIRRGQLETGVRNLLLGTVASVMPLPLVYTDLGVIGGLSMAVIVWQAAALLLPANKVIRYLGLGVVAGLLTGAIDLLGIQNRISLGLTTTYAYTISISLGLILVWLLIRNYSSFRLQAKFISAVVLLAVLSISITIIFVTLSTQSLLTDEFGQDLSDLANSQSTAIGEFFGRELRSLEALALNNQLADSALEQSRNYGTVRDEEIAAILDERDELWRTDPYSNDPFVIDPLRNEGSRVLRDFERAFPNNSKLMLTDRYGGLVSATERILDYEQSDENWWRQAYADGAGDIYVGNPQFDSVRNQMTFVIALPIIDRSGFVQGVLRTEYVLRELVGVLSGGSRDRVDVSLLVDRRLVQVDTNNTLELDLLSIEDEVPYDQALGVPFATAEIDGETQLISRAPIRTFDNLGQINALGWEVVTTQPIDEALTVVRSQQRTQAILGILIVLVGGIAAAVVGRLVSGPILRLADVATAVADGNLDARADVETGDEISDLAVALNRMTDQLQSTLEGLEERVLERTQALQTSVRVSRTLSTIIEQDKLVNAVVNQLQESFDYYHVHVYLVNRADQRLEMAGGSGEAGQQLLARGHSLDMTQGLVGRAARSNAPVLVPDVTQDPDWRPNKLLPETKSEAAVPIALGEDVLGVIDVQENEVNRLSDEDISLLQGVASQTAVALRNAEFYESASRQAMRESLINDIRQKIQQTRDVDAALKTAVRELNIAVNSDQTTVRLEKNLDTPSTANGNHS